MNTHEHLSIEILADYAEGLLGDADSTSVADHLASCADCQAEADLLVSLSAILAADDPGPMPTEYADRIDAALADLAAAEPVTPKRSESATVGAGATVIDLASRRRFTPAARVTSVAASLVLLVGGVALGMQALNTDDSGTGVGALLGETPQPTPTDQPAPSERAALLAARQKPVGSNAKKGKHGAVIDKTDGTVFLNNKVYFPDGSKVVHRKNGESVVTIASTKTGGKPEVRTIRATTPEPGVTVTPQPTPEPTATPSPTGTPKATPVPSNSPAVDAYVTSSGATYTEDNFATKVRTLLSAAGETTGGSVSAQSHDTSSAPSPADQNRVSSSAVRSDDSTATRGNAPADVVARVKRCADQLKLSPVVVADAGTWKGQPATVLVVRSAGATQSTGYVVYGDCSKDAPATQADVPWYQTVDVPAADEPTPSPSPTANPGTEGSVTPSVSSGVSDTVTPSVTNSLSTSTEQ